MESDKDVNEQFDEKNQAQEGRAKKGTSNAKNYTYRCTDVRLHKIFVALPEEKKGILRTTYFVPLLLIDLIATMLTLVVEIFDHHLDDVLRLNLLKIILSFLLPNKGRNVEVSLKFPRMHECIHLFLKLQGWRMTSFKRRQIVTFKKVFANPQLLVIAMMASETDIQQELVQEAMQVTPGEGLEVVKDLMVDDDVEVRMEVNLEAISSEYGGGLLEWKKGHKKDGEDEKDDDDDDEKDVEEKMEEWKNGDEKVDDVEKNGEEKAKSEEEQPLAAEEEDLEQPTVVTMVAAEVAKTDIIFFNQEEVVGEAYQTKESKENEDVDEASQ
ncbi:hypothetical protein GIB67_031580, partial [Kingdonia uniflora]